MEGIRGFITRTIDWFNNLDGKRRLYAAIVALIVIALLAFALSKIRIGGNLINYKEINMDSIKLMNVNTDKDLYTKCDLIVKRLVETYYGNYKLSTRTVELNDYYEHTKLEEYSISKSKFNKRFKTIIDEMQTEKNATIGNINSFYPIIDKIYTYSDTNKLYFIKFKTDEDHVLGVQVREDRFYIFYIE